MRNKAIARFADGHWVKGTTLDFSPTRELFHMRGADAPPGSPPVTIHVRDLKFLAFVYDLEGDPRGRSTESLRQHHPAHGTPVRVTFNDGEVLLGTTTTYKPGASGFFVEPAAEGANEERIYVVSAATREVAVMS